MGERKNKKMTRDGGWREEDDGEVVVRGGVVNLLREDDTIERVRKREMKGKEGGMGGRE